MSEEDLQLRALNSLLSEIDRYKPKLLKDCLLNGPVKEPESELIKLPFVRPTMQDNEIKSKLPFLPVRRPEFPTYLGKLSSPISPTIQPLLYSRALASIQNSEVKDESPALKIPYRPKPEYSGKRFKENPRMPHISEQE